MRTARSCSRLGGVSTRHPPDQATLREQVPPPDQAPPWNAGTPPPGAGTPQEQTPLTL